MLQLIYAPHPIFKKSGQKVESVNREIQDIAQAMVDNLYVEKAVGLAANMFGVLKRIIVVDLQENNERNPKILINPEIIYKSPETQTIEEASVCFLGISANITRSKIIKVKYLDHTGAPQELEAEGLLSSVIQHEIEYLDGKTFLDNLSQMKKELLLKKMEKYLKLHPPHVHSASCNH